jgi:hypothetical protein
MLSGDVDPRRDVPVGLLFVPGLPLLLLIPSPTFRRGHETPTIALITGGVIASLVVTSRGTRLSALGL